jgi:hypothetical protein
MIKANELRIGNKVLHQRNPQLHEIETILGFLNDSVFLSADHEGVTYPKSLNSIESIPITPEVLEKCGFEENMGGWYLEGSINQKTFSSDDRKFGWCMNLSDVDKKDIHFRFGYSSVPINDSPARHIKYLHQLQNLYFALTGEELTVNL